MLAIIASFAFIVLLAYAIYKKKRRLILYAIPVLIVIIIASWKNGSGFRNRLTLSIYRTFHQKSGMEIYTALFGAAPTNCVAIVNYKDQVVPKVDCCIWLEFKTCPEELNRIINRKTFATGDTISLSTYTPKPIWWKPAADMQVLRSYNSEKPDRDVILLFDRDSSHAFYCDMAE